MSDWTAWSECTQACGTGSETRTRTILAPAANGGLPCGDTEEHDPCNTARCPEDRAAILVDRIRKLELQDRINTLEELQATQAAQLAASQTADLLSQVAGGGASTSTGAAAPAFIEMPSILDMLSEWSQKHQQHIHVNDIPVDVARLRQQRATVASLQSLKTAIAEAKSELHELRNSDSGSKDKDKDVTVMEADDEDEVTDEVDAQGHHHKKHHHRRRHSQPSFSQTAPASGSQLDPVPPLFTHTVVIPAGNNNDLISTHESKHR